MESELNFIFQYITLEIIIETFVSHVGMWYKSKLKLLKCLYGYLLLQDLLQFIIEKLNLDLDKIDWVNW